MLVSVDHISQNDFHMFFQFFLKVLFLIRQTKPRIARIQLHMVIEELSNQLFMIIEVSVVEREKNNYGKQEKKNLFDIFAWEVLTFEFHIEHANFKMK